MSHADDATLYRRWAALIDEFRTYADARGLRLDKESDLGSYVYRMERPYDLSTTVQTVSLGRPDGTPVLIASVSAPGDAANGIHLRLLGGHQTWHLHPGEAGLMLGKQPFTRERMTDLLDRVFETRARG